MMRILRIGFLVAVVAAQPAWAFRVLEQPESSYELVLGEVGIPRSLPGSLNFKPCSDCLSTSLRLNTKTIFIVGQQAVDFDEFRNVAEKQRQKMGGNQNTGIFAFYDAGTKQVNRLVLRSYLAD